MERLTMMYEDKNTWKQHYDEWKRIYPTVTNDYRKKLFERLIQDYKRFCHNTHEVNND